MKLLLAFFVVMSFQAKANITGCKYSFQDKETTVGWTAFKTPKKVGVKGKFSKFKMKAKAGDSVEMMLAKASFEINTASVDTTDKARDAKIVNFFFKKMPSNKITGKVLKSENGKLEVQLNLNGVKKVVPMAYSYDDVIQKLAIVGSIDVLDFSMKSNLATLTKACFEKHEGVTWPNVDFEFLTTLKRVCP
jgi:polyisoprenoid-binding protein YceI